MTQQKDRFITVVSGLPRSGTSMMMRMLEKGGMSILTDGLRQADDDNPLGYYEFEPVKQLEKDASWLHEAYDKAVKVIYVFLYHLPPGYSYKVIFMKRGLDDVIASQNIMLRHRHEGEGMSDQELMSSYHDQLQKLNVWLRQRRNFMVQYFDYEDVVSDPEKAALEICGFLGRNLDTRAMIESVVPSLHRNRSSAA